MTSGSEQPPPSPAGAALGEGPAALPLDEAIRLLDLAHDAILVRDLDGTIRFWNQGAAELYGWSKDEAVGKSSHALLRTQFPRPLADIDAELLDRGRWDGELIQARRDGRKLVVASRWALRRDDPGRPGIVLEINRDMTQRKDAEAALRASEERFRLLVEGTRDYAIFMLDPHGRVASWNPGAARITGYVADEIIGQQFSRFYPPEDVQAGKPDRELRIAAAEGRFEDEGWRLRKDGSRFWSTVVVTALYDEAGRLRGFSKITRDTTARKQAEEQSRRLLEEEAARKAAEASAQEALAAKEALRESDRNKDEFLALLGHELRNPLAPIRNALHVLRLRGGQPEALEWAEAIMERQVRHMTRMIDDLLDISRIGRGKIGLARERLDLVELVRATTDDHRSILEGAGLRLDVDLPDRPVWVHGDPTRLAQALGNLLVNACKFTDVGGQVQVRLAVDPERERAAMAVRDTGIGIEPEALPHLFEAFHQADRSLHRSRGGLGLGLALVKGLVELHGGGVEAHSQGAGRGSDFTFWLPLEEQPAASARATDLPLPGGSLRVLVIEDSRDAAESLRMVLELFGHRVQTAHTGPSGLDEARRYRPDVILCDLGLPGLDGYGVAEALRRDPSLAGVRLIALSGYGSTSDLRRCRDVGFERHLTKPVEPNVLLRVLNTPPS